MSTATTSKPVYTTSTNVGTTRIEFFAARNAALGKQRDAAVARLAVLRTDLAGIVSATSSGTSSDIAKAITVVERMATTERKLVEDIERLNTKIGK